MPDQEEPRGISCLREKTQDTWCTQDEERVEGVVHIQGGSEGGAGRKDVSLSSIQTPGTIKSSSNHLTSLQEMSLSNTL